MINKKFIFNTLLLITMVSVGGYALTQGDKITSVISPSLPEMTTPVSEEVVPVSFPADETVFVSITDFSFLPAEIRIKTGTKVIWKNEDKAKHNAAAEGREFKGPLLAQGETYEFVFEKKGDFPYVCDPHPWMKGKVIVE